MTADGFLTGVTLRVKVPDMWKTFKNNENLYLIKSKRENSALSVYLTDLQNVWLDNNFNEEILNKFQLLNPLVDIKLEDAVNEVVNLIDLINNESDITLNLNDSKNELFLKSKLGDQFEIEYKLDFTKAPPDILLKEVTIPLIHTVKCLEEQQKMLCNLVQKKDRELEEYKLEKGDITRGDLVTEKFDHNLINNNNVQLMTNIFGDSEHWEGFLQQKGQIPIAVPKIRKDPWNERKKKRKIYSASTAVKKNAGIVYKTKSSDQKK